MAAITERGFQIPRRIAEGVAEHLEWQIVYGVLEPEARLREEDVSERYQVSRSPVREALDHLERDGLLIRLPRRGVHVAPVSESDLRELYGVRVSLEGQAASEAAIARSQPDLLAMKTALGAMEQAMHEADVRGFFRANVGLSEAIYRATGNATLRRLLAIIEKQARRYRYIAFARRPNLIAASVAGNSRIVAAIERSDGDAAETITRDLITNSQHQLRDVLVSLTAGTDV